jgi:hypothetical protein
LKGSIVAIFALDNSVVFNFASPTGSETDTAVFHLPCTNNKQAQGIVEMYREKLGIVKYGLDQYER